MFTVDQIVADASKRRASDIHISLGLPVQFRIDGRLTSMDEHILTREDCDAYAREIAGVEYERALREYELDLGRTYSGVRCRLNLFRQQRAFSAAIRLLSQTIPTLEELGLPPVVGTFAQYARGLVIVTGETGSGKSTTMAALLNEVNHTRSEHIITLEDPIEYIYEQDKCLIDQRELGADVESFSQGLRAALREDPDIILVGEMRDLATIETALTAAETGHLVFGTLHTNSAADSIDRMVDIFPAERQRQIRLQLSMTLQAVLSQQLLPRMGKEGRVPACEVMVVSAAIRNLIREGKTPQIFNAISTSAADGSMTMDHHLSALCSQRIISREEALAAAHNPEYMKKGLFF